MRLARRERAAWMFGYPLNNSFALYLKIGSIAPAFRLQNHLLSSAEAMPYFDLQAIQIPVMPINLPRNLVIRTLAQALTTITSKAQPSCKALHHFQCKPAQLSGCLSSFSGIPDMGCVHWLRR